MHHALVIGGSGFVGSAVCKACVARGWSVTSLSRSGDDGLRSLNRPTWADKVSWRKGSIDDPQVLQELMPQATAVVHTLGILLESDYKSSFSSLASGLLSGLRENLLDHSSKNPLRATSDAAQAGKYELVNRDSALTVARAFSDSAPTAKSERSSYAFVYVSAEDVFRPFVPARYISTKREAEAGISAIASHPDKAAPGRSIRPVFMRPSLMYHPDIRPPSMIGAIPLKLANAIHERIPSSFHVHNIAKELSSRTRSASPLSPAYTEATKSIELPPIHQSVVNLLSIPPVHVDTVAEAICDAIEYDRVRGVVGVRDMLKLEQTRTTTRRMSESSYQTLANTS